MITFALPYACYASHVGAMGSAKVRTISGLPSRLKHNNITLIRIQFFTRISKGLRKFWEKATVLRFVVMACCKQYCLTRIEGELYCVGKLQNRSPKILCSLEFSLVTFFVSRQRK